MTATGVVTAASPRRRWHSGTGPVEPYGRAAVLAALALMGIGILMVYSASSPRAGVSYDDPEFFLRRQLAWAVVGVATIWAFMRLDPAFLARWAKPLLVVSLLALALVLVPGLGHMTKGARRWFRLGPLSFQPSELAKLALVVWLAAHLDRAAERLSGWKAGILPALGPLAVAAGLVLLEPDFGTALFLGAVGAAMVLVGGVPLRKLAVASLAAVPVVAWHVIQRWDVVVRRFSVLGGGEGDTDAVHQVRQSLLALGSGGFLGEGVGAGRQKLLYLPEAHTDFILPVVGEELGFAGTALVLALFALLALAGLRIALAAAHRDRFAFLLAFGLVFWVGLQAAGNVAVVTGSVPTKGIALPFVSLGGSSLLTLCAAVGLLYSVAARCDAGTAIHDAGTEAQRSLGRPEPRGVPSLSSPAVEQDGVFASRDTTSVPPCLWGERVVAVRQGGGA